jgi:hypothetical protein
MRSPWLDWPNSSQIIRQITDSEGTKLTKPAFGSFGTSAPVSFPIISGQELPITDPYAERMQAALRQIAVPSYPQGMILWLETGDPQAYAELTSDIPDEIARLWKERAPLQKFEAVLSRFVSLHWRCREAYVGARTGSKRVLKTSPFDFGTSTGDGGAQ